MKMDEVKCIKYLLDKEKTFYINWKMTCLCNYECDFCIQGDREYHLKKARKESDEIRNKIYQAIRDFMDKLEGYNKIEFKLVGGEITVLNDFPEILEGFAKSKFKGEIVFLLTTNFSKPAKYFCDIFDKIKLIDKPHKRVKVRLITSYYSAYVTQEEFCEKVLHIMNHIDTSQKSTPNFECWEPCMSMRITYPIIKTSDYYDYLKLKEIIYPTTIVPIFIREYENDISKEVLDKLFEEGNKTKNVSVTDVYGEESIFFNITALGKFLEDSEYFRPNGNFTCDAGIKRLRIDPLGNIKRCPSIEEKIGNIVKDGINLYKEPQICNATRCSCNAFGTIERTKESMESIKAENNINMLLYTNLENL